MNTIKRDVYVLRNTIKIPIEVTKGTDAISFEFTVRDYNLPVTAAAVAYAYRMGMKKPNSTLCDVSGNVISFQPSANFFEVGNNELQIRVINEDKSLISFKEKVKCSDSMGFPDEEEEKQKSLVEQLVAYTGKETTERKAADATEKSERMAADTTEKAERMVADTTEKAERMVADATEKAERQKEIDVERKRINQLTKLPAGSTSGDAELQDIRVGADGKTYETAGEAVRGQIGQVKEDIVKIGTKIVSENLLDYSKIESGYYDLSGVFHESGTYAHAKVYVDDLVGKTIYFSRDNVSDIFNFNVSFVTEYDSKGSVVRITNAKNVNSYTIPEGVTDIVVSTTTINLCSTTMFTLNFVPQKFIPYFEPYFKANDKFVSDLQLQINDLKGAFTVVECWGNSLTKGVGASESNYENAYPNQLQKMLGDGYIVNNLGIGGEGTKQIAARQGGKLSFVQPFTIPEDTIAADVTFFNDDGEDIKHQTQKGNGVNPCYINGVKGTVTWDKNRLINTFTRETAGDEIKISRETPLVTDGMINHRGNIMVIWVGTNDKPKTKEKAQYIIDSIRDMIAYAKTEKYIVIGLTSKAYMGDFIDTCTKMWSQNFGTKFINARKYLLNYALADEYITPTEQDKIDIENGEIPSSLRADNDPVHLNAKGYHCIARLTHERGKLLGYW